MSEAGWARARRWGVQPRYRDATGSWHTVPESTLEAILDAMGAAPRGRPPADGTPRVVGAGAPHPLDGDAVVTLESGEERTATGSLPADLPLGYHRLRQGDAERLLVVAPRRCHRAPGVRWWGWAAQLYALRSHRSWGMGDLADLRRLARWSADELGAAFVLVNPLHAGPVVAPQEASPYFPSSRRFRNPLYLRIAEVPGADTLGARLEALDRSGRALNESRLIDRDAAWALKAEALDLLWARFTGDPAFDRFLAGGGEELARYATFCVLSERHGRPWQSWPAPLRHPAGEAVAAVRQEAQDRVRFHCWVQWLLDVQLAAASAPLAVVHDLAIGADPAGADAWLWQESLSGGVTVGAPPDEFNTLGQNWGLPPFDPWKLRSARYGPFIETIRAGFRHAGGLRIDHVMGLFRLYWIPEGASAAAGAYVSYPSADLLGIVALESVRAGALVIGEDLGTVEPRIRRDLAARDVLSYRLLWFEERPPSRWPRRALGAVTTHDLPTVAGLWSGADLRTQAELGLEPNVAGTTAIRARLQSQAGLAGGAPAGDVILAAHRLLATAPSALLSATLDDMAGVAERPNMPGTTPDRYPNWSLALPAPLEELTRSEQASRIAQTLAARGRSGGRPPRRRDAAGQRTCDGFPPETDSP